MMYNGPYIANEYSISNGCDACVVCVCVCGGGGESGKIEIVLELKSRGCRIFQLIPNYDMDINCKTRHVVATACVCVILTNPQNMYSRSYWLPR